MMKRSKNVGARKQSVIEEKSNLLKNIENTSELKIHFLKHMSNRLLNLKGVSLFYNNKEICSNISFEVNQGDRIALYGKNGCGKSTTLKFINGNDKIKLTGNFEKASNLKISYVSQDTSHLTGNPSDSAKSENIDESLIFHAFNLKRKFLTLVADKKRKYSLLKVFVSRHTCICGTNHLTLLVFCLVYKLRS